MSCAVCVMYMTKSTPFRTRHSHKPSPAPSPHMYSRSEAQHLSLTLGTVPITYRTYYTLPFGKPHGSLQQQQFVPHQAPTQSSRAATVDQPWPLRCSRASRRRRCRVVPDQAPTRSSRAAMVDQPWPLRCSQATRRRRRVCAGSPLVSAACRCAVASSCSSRPAPEQAPLAPLILQTLKGYLAKCAQSCKDALSILPGTS